MVKHFILHFAECQIRAPKNVGSAEAQMPRMPNHIEESDGTRPALRGVHPITRPGIISHVTFTAIPNVEPVKRVIENRQPDAEQFKPHYERKAAEKFDLFGICARASRGERIGDKMLNQEQANRNNSAEGVQPAQQK